ncbi:MAG: T9SS type A sorting domain-containing protein [Lewinellaceae bacterium]|nr:T9SS type A sorting domain-containing protein [Saprospiraceae bacterium]MCB9340050.1 T9SS type A sorting domain-containing protein [Lewinellaceae bacterium]
MKTFITLTALLVLAFTQNTNAQTYVNAAATGNNDGSSWADAYTTLYAALENYSDGDEIWVAAGTYLPGQPSAWPGDPKNTFYLHQNVSVYGGFNGTETMLSERDPTTYLTVLSGDLNGDDMPDDFETNREDNANNLVYIDTTASATIDGFTISGGHADGDTTQYYNRRGAAIFSWGVVQLNGCTVEQNFTIGLAAVFMQGDAAEGSSIANSIFRKNKAVSGAAIVALFLGGEGISITGCQFMENEFEGVAGAIGLEATASISDCQFSNNSGGIGGGAIFIQSWTFSDFEVTVTDCDFENNSAVTGGAFYYLSVENGNNKLSFNGCEFRGHKVISAQAGDFPDGGAMRFEFSDGNPTNDSIIIADCLFENNTAELRGGGIAYFNGTGTDNFLEISNSTFSENASVTFGGGIHFSNYGADHMEVNLTGNEFVNNSSTDGGGVVFFSTNGEHNNFSVTSCDFTGNRATELSAGDTPDGGGIYVNFQNPGDTLQFNTVTVEDCTLEGNSAEKRGGGIIVLNNTGNDNQFFATNCQVSGNTSGEGGGGFFLANFGGTDFEANISESDFTDNSSNHGGASYYVSNNGDNNNLLFSDCNFTSNTAITSPTFQFPDGGALGFQYSNGNPSNDHILLENCVLENNSAERFGGGIAFFDSYGTDNLFEVSNCQISENAGDEAGGGFYLRNNGATNFGVNISGSDFSDNRTEGVGGGIQFQNDNGTDHDFLVSACDFSNNHADLFGGGFRMESQVPGANLTFADCLFDGNSAINDGGGLEVVLWMQSNGETTVSNTDFLNNTSGNEGAGLNFYLQDLASGSLSVNGALFSGNTNDASGNAKEGAGGFSLINFGNGVANVDFQSTIFENNSSQDGAGAIQLHKTGTTTDLVNIENCLLANNSGGDFGGGIGLNGDIGLTLTGNTIADNSNVGVVLSNGTVAMQNNIVHNPGTQDFFFGLTANNVASLGGNLIGDNTMDANLNSADQSGADPMFEAGSFQLSQNSPAVDAGVLPDNLTATDLAGNDRIQGGCIDIGALESPHDAGTACLTTGSREVLADQSTVFIYPNPVSATASISIENSWNGELNLRIVNALGQVVHTVDFEKFDRTAVLEFDASDLPEGMYRVLVSDGETMAVSSFVKD